jgi:hypothetical protein
MLPNGTLVVVISDRKVVKTVYRMVAGTLPGAGGEMQVYLRYAYPKCQAQVGSSIWRPEGDIGLRKATEDEIRADMEKAQRRTEL